jgi:hypothetical protein
MVSAAPWAVIHLLPPGDRGGLIRVIQGRRAISLMGIPATIPDPRGRSRSSADTAGGPTPEICLRRIDPPPRKPVQDLY